MFEAVDVVVPGAVLEIVEGVPDVDVDGVEEGGSRMHRCLAVFVFVFFLYFSVFSEFSRCTMTIQVSA